MNRIRNAIVAGIASAPVVVGLMLAAPTNADPSDLNHQICASFDQQGLNLRSLLAVEVQLNKTGINGGVAVRQAVATDCPKYESELAEAVREAGVENSRIPNGGPGDGHCDSGNYNPLRGDCEVYPYSPPQPGY